MWTPLWYVLVVELCASHGNTPERYLTKSSHTGLLLSKDVSTAQLSLGGNEIPVHMAFLYRHKFVVLFPVLMLLLEKTKTPDLNVPRKLMERTIRTVSCACYQVYRLSLLHCFF